MEARKSGGRILRVLVTTSVVLGISPSTPSYAQAVLEEVIVTARKREESLQATPVAVTALRGVDLVAAGIQNLADLQKLAPNVDVQNGNGQAGACLLYTSPSPPD